MEVVCPNCRSRFKLPQGTAKPGAKLRCSVCKTVFPLSLPDGQPQEEQLAFEPEQAKKSSQGLSLPSAPKRSKKLFILVAVVLVLAIGGACGAWWYLKGQKVQPPPVSTVPLTQKLEKLSMRNVRQYYVNNEKIGPISVIEGKVVNGFASPKELIEIEAALYGQDKSPLMTKRQHAGTSLSLFQLQVLEEKNLETFINNKLEVLANNTNVPPGGEVPFMVLFYKPPPSVAEFGVKIVDVRDPEIQK